jgi:hypothetical protein
LREGGKWRKNDAMFPPPRITLLKALPCLCLAVLAQASPAQFSMQAIPYESQDMFLRQITWDENRPSKTNPNGLHIQFSKTDETTSSGKRVMHYRAYVTGVPESKRYSLAVWRIGSEPRILSNSVYVNAKGLLMVHQPRLEQNNSDFLGDEEFQLTVQAARAEPVRYALASSDKELLVYGTVVPFPLKDIDRGCQLEMRLSLPDATAVLVYADGFPANAEIPYQLLSNGDLKMRKFNVDAQGHAVATVFPATNGMERGSLRLTVSTPECSAAVELPWGEGSYHPL